MGTSRQISRRAVLAAAGSQFACGGITAAQPAGRELRFVRPGETIKGIDTVAPVDNWAALSYGLSMRRTAALHEAGFNTLRVFIPLREFARAQDPAYGLSLDLITDRWANYVRRGVNAGFKVIACWGYRPEESADLLGGAGPTDRFRRSLAVMGKRLSDDFDPGLVAMEVMNEPPYEENLWKAYTSVFAPLFFSDVRSAAPSLTVILQSAAGGAPEAISKFDPKQFDANTMFCFHFYIPGEFTHQGVNYRDLYGIPFPITRYPGGQSAMAADTEARIAADHAIDEAEKRRLIATYRPVLDYLWNPKSPLGPDWIQWPKLDAWIAANRIDSRRILCGEFGVVSGFNYNGSPGIDLLSRVNYMRSVRQNVEARGFGGWVAHQAFGDFNLFQEASVSQHKDALIPELVDALFR